MNFGLSVEIGLNKSYKGIHTTRKNAGYNIWEATPDLKGHWMGGFADKPTLPFPHSSSYSGLFYGTILFVPEPRSYSSIIISPLVIIRTCQYHVRLITEQLPTEVNYIINYRFNDSRVFHFFPVVVVNVEEVQRALGKNCQTGNIIPGTLIRENCHWWRFIASTPVIASSPSSSASHHVAAHRRIHGNYIIRPSSCHVANPYVQEKGNSPKFACLIFLRERSPISFLIPWCGED